MTETATRFVGPRDLPSAHRRAGRGVALGRAVRARAPRLACRGGRRLRHRAGDRERHREARARPRRRPAHDHRARDRGAARRRAGDERAHVAARRHAARTSRRCARAACTSSSPRAASSPAATWARAGSRRSRTSPRRCSPRRGALADLAGVRVLVTAGATRGADRPRALHQQPRERQDRLRDRRGGRPPRRRSHARQRARRRCPTRSACDVVRVTTALQMRDAVTRALRRMRRRGRDAPRSPTSGPSDPSPEKLKKADAPLAIELERNPDILAELGETKGDRVLVGFAAETQDVLDEARAQARRRRTSTCVSPTTCRDGRPRLRQ